jgi:hypothetical protein
MCSDLVTSIDRQLDEFRDSIKSRKTKHLPSRAQLTAQKAAFSDRTTVSWHIRDRPTFLAFGHMAVLGGSLQEETYLDAIVSPVPFVLHYSFVISNIKLVINRVIGSETHIVTLRSFAQEVAAWFASPMNQPDIERICSTVNSYHQTNMRLMLSPMSTYDRFLGVALPVYDGLRPIPDALSTMAEYMLTLKPPPSS